MEEGEEALGHTAVISLIDEKGGIVVQQRATQTSSDELSSRAEHRFSAIRTACATTRNSSTAKPARISGQIDFGKTSPISSSCKMTWWRDWPTR